uniref:BESS domain-containing protein n=1 Tax=Clastoptera arizonana TaxID=38151 RepID=A0A1B6DI60_9HEMI
MSASSLYSFVKCNRHHIQDTLGLSFTLDASKENPTGRVMHGVHSCGTKTKQKNKNTKHKTLAETGLSIVKEEDGTLAERSPHEMEGDETMQSDAPEESQGQYQALVHPSSAPTSPLPPKKRMISWRTRETQLLEMATSLLARKKSEAEVFAKSIGQQLNTLEPLQLTIAQKLISDTVFYAKMGQLTPASAVSIVPSHVFVVPTSTTPSAPQFNHPP